MQRWLKGRLVRGEDAWLFAFDDGRVLPLSQLSSGSKELMPLFSVLEMYEYQRPLTPGIEEPVGPQSWFIFDDFFIEEPEGHIFPDMQKELVRYFAELSNTASLRPHFTITTHSPYILSSFNNLLQAWQVGMSGPDATKKEVAALIDERYWIDPKDFKAYSIHDGQLESIMDEETGLINGTYLDGVSDEIGSQFDELLRIGYAKA